MLTYRTNRNSLRRTGVISVALFFTLLIASGFAAQPAAARNAPAAIHDQADPCRDSQGREICLAFQRNDGRINSTDPLQTATGYCQADHGIQIWTISNGVGQAAATATAAQVVSGIQAAVSANTSQTILNAQGLELLGLPDGLLQLVDMRSGYVFTFSPTVCGLPPIAGNANPAPQTSVTPGASTSTVTIPALPTTIDIPAVAPIGAQIQNTLRFSLRSGPGYTYARIITIPRGSFLTVLGKVPMNNGLQWIEVQYGPVTGWLLAYYTNINVRELRRLPIVNDFTGSGDLTPTVTATPGS